MNKDLTYEEVKDWLVNNKPLRASKGIWLCLYSAVCKQISRKPIKVDEHEESKYDKWFTYKCPSCGSVWSINNIESASDYCCDCGQKYDLNGVKDDTTE